MYSAGPAGSAGAAAVGPETITEAVLQSGAVFIPNPYHKSLWIHARKTYHHFAQILLSMGVSRLGTRTVTEVTFAPAPPITGFLEFAVKTYEFAGLPSGRRFVYAVYVE